MTFAQAMADAKKRAAAAKQDFPVVKSAEGEYFVVAGKPPYIPIAAWTTPGGQEWIYEKSAKNEKAHR